MDLNNKLGNAMQSFDEAEAAVIEAFERFMLDPSVNADELERAVKAFKEAEARLDEVQSEVVLREELMSELFVEANEIAYEKRMVE